MAKKASYLSVFALLFLLPGLGIFSYTLWQTGKTLQAQNWDQVQATVLAANLEVNRDSDSTTYKATGTYEYYYESKRYQSERIFFTSHSDNLGSYQKDAYQTLKSHLDSQQAMTIRVDPDRPDQSIAIDKVHGWGVLLGTAMGLIFAAVGGGLICLDRYSAKVAQFEEQQKMRYPDQPWMWDERWYQKTIKSSNRAFSKFSVIFALIWCLCTFPLVLLVPSLLSGEEYTALFVLLFPVAGLVLAKWALGVRATYKRFGEPTIRLDRLPVALGRCFQAELIAQGDIPSNSALEMTLSCIRKHSRGKHSSENIIWQDEQKLFWSGQGNIRAPIRFDLPPDEPPTQPLENGVSIIWRLVAKSKIDGADFNAQFDLPVFNFNQSTSADDSHSSYLSQSDADGLLANNSDDWRSNHLSISDDDGAHRSHEYDQRGEWQRTEIESRSTMHGYEYVAPAARHAGTGSIILLFGLAFGGAGVFMVMSSEGWLSIFSYLFGGLFVLIGVFILLAGIQILLQRCQLTVSRSKLISHKSYLGIGRQRIFERDQLVDVYIKSRMSIGTQRYYSVLAKLQNGKDHVLFFGLPGKRDTLALAQRVKHQFGL